MSEGPGRSDLDNTGEQPLLGGWADANDYDDDGVAGLFGDEGDPVPRGQAARTRRSRPAPAPHRSQRGRRNGRRSGGLLAGVLIVVVLLIAGVIGGGVYLGNRVFGGGTSDADYSGSGSGAVTIQVHSGDGPDAIGATLTTLGVTKSGSAFVKAASANPKSSTISPGYYSLKMHMSGAAAVALLLTPSAALRSKVTVPEGSSLARTLALIASHTSLKAADLAAAVANPVALGLPSYANNHVQGFLFPATYQVEPGTQAVDALQQFTQAFKVEAETVGLEAGAKALGMTPYQIVTIASLIEGEAAKAADRPKVAEVIYNRLKDGKNLGLESTVRYALNGGGGTRILQSQLQKAAASPYDTYTHPGLPPGPIDNPGGDALMAALHPATGDDIYFVTLPKTNETVFTPSEATFNMLTIECQAQGGC